MFKHKLVSLSLAALVTLGLSGLAQAGVGGSFAKIRSAAEHGAVDAILSELERAEDIPCTTECMSYVIGLTDHDDYRVREAAAWWLARRPAQKAEVTEAALAELVGGNPTAVRNAADVLGTFSHPSAVTPLAAAYGRASLTGEARVAIVRALGRIGHRSANPALEAAMVDGDAAVRREAVVAWRGVLRQSAAAPVAALVADADVSVRREATAVVGMFRQASGRVALEALVASDADPMTRRNAAWALGRIGDGASRAALVAAASQPAPLVRMTARAALRQLR